MLVSMLAILTENMPRMAMNQMEKHQQKAFSVVSLEGETTDSKKPQE